LLALVEDLARQTRWRADSNNRAGAELSRLTEIPVF